MTAIFRTSQNVSDVEVGKPHLILVGLPGAGKSAVGEALAERLNRSFLDFDREIERREGSTISEIFAVRGEPYFRQLEVELTLELRQCGNMVVAPGGGWVTNKGVLEIIRPPAILLYLKVRPETALNRFLADRETLYSQADHVVSTEVLDVKRVVDQLVELASTIKAG
jgi:shikimate kinase